MIRLFFLVLCIFLSGCGQPDQKAPVTHRITLLKHPLTNNYYYSGTVQPLSSFLIVSPVDGNIDSMLFHYGDHVQKDQALFTIFSEKFQTDYKNALMQYVKAKTEFNNAKIQLEENEFLHKNQLISEDDFKNKKSTFYTAQLNFVDAKDALAALLKQLNLKTFDPDQLSIEDIDTLTRALHLTDQSKKIRLVTPFEGIVLEAQESQSDTKIKKMTVGQQVKQGDALALIGDVSGLSVHIDVDEFTINQIKLGQNVKVTGAAFPQWTLAGTIAEIDRQGQREQGLVPLFSVQVIVPKLTTSQQQGIQMGMTAKVEIQNQSAPVITVPIAAVFEKNGTTYVNIQSTNNTVMSVPVKTGMTTTQEVVVAGNLHEGDQVVFSN